MAVVERYLSETDVPPSDYRLYCFDGRVRIIAVDQHQFSEHTRSYFDDQWQQLPVSVDDVRVRAVPPPAGLEQMIGLAQRLSTGIDFVRVDLYDLDGTIKFGELTAYPGGGVNVFAPKIWDRTFGSHWTQRV